MMRMVMVMLLAACLALGGAAPLAWAQTSQDKVKAANEKAAQDYFKYGLILAEENRYADAVKAFRQALGIKPDWAEAHSLLGSALNQAGDLHEAEAELRKAVQLKPDYAEGWNYLGEFLKARGKQKEADEAFAKPSSIFGPNRRSIQEDHQAVLAVGGAVIDEAVGQGLQAVQMLSGEGVVYTPGLAGFGPGDICGLASSSNISRSLGPCSSNSTAMEPGSWG